MLNAGNFTTKAALSAIDDWLDKEIVGIQSVLHNHSIFVAVVTKSLHYDHFYEYDIATHHCQLAEYQQLARMAELVDALDSKSSSREGVRVRPPLRVPLLNVTIL